MLLVILRIVIYPSYEVCCMKYKIKYVKLNKNVNLLKIEYKDKVIIYINSNT